VLVAAPFGVEPEDVVYRRRLALQLRRAAHGVGVLADELEGQHA
jgi:hypothetical protein